MGEIEENKDKKEMVELEWREEWFGRWNRKFKRNDTGEKGKGKKGGIEGTEEGGVERKEGESIERVEGWNVVFWNVAGLRTQDKNFWKGLNEWDSNCSNRDMNKGVRMKKGKR